MFVNENDLELVKANFDPEFYARQLEGTVKDASVLARHYCELGWIQGMDPSDTFSTTFYLAENPDIYVGQSNPFIHYLKHGKAEGRLSKFKASSQTKSFANLIKPHFDAAFYLEKYTDEIVFKDDPLEDYISYGARLGRWPNADFCPTFYVMNNPDLTKHNFIAFLHYISDGKAEGRAAKTEMVEALTSRRSNLYAHFDRNYYMRQVTAEHHKLYIDWLDHYLIYGWKDNLNPCRIFDAKKYFERYPDINTGHTEPFSHFLEHGLYEGRDNFMVGL